MAEDLVQADETATTTDTTAAAEGAAKPADDKAADDKGLGDELEQKGLPGGTPKKDDADLLSDDGEGDGEGKGDGDVPETYTFEPPEGFEANEDFQAGIEEFTPVAKELGLSQEKFQKIVEFDINRSQQMEKQFIDRWGERVDQWRETARKDREMGVDADFKETLGHAQNALNQLGTPGLRAFMRSPSQDNPDGLAVGNHPEMLRFLSRVGKAIADPSLLTGDVTDTADDAGLRRMYPSMYKKDA